MAEESAEPLVPGYCACVGCQLRGGAGRDAIGRVPNVPARSSETAHRSRRPALNDTDMPPRHGVWLRLARFGAQIAGHPCGVPLCAAGPSGQTANISGRLLPLPFDVAEMRTGR